MSIISIDPQASGWRDDGSESGLVRVEPTRGNLVAVPVRALQYYAEIVGAGSGTAFTPAAVTSNPDGSGSSLNFTVASLSPPGGGIRVWMPFYGRGFGIRWRRDAAVAPLLSVSVDGVAVEVDLDALDHLTVEGVVAGVYSDNEARAVTHPNLNGYGPHIAEIVLTQRAYPSVVSSSLVLFGWLLDQDAGYRVLPSLAHLQPTIALTTSAVEIPVGRGFATALRAIRKVIYTNTSASPVVVTVKNGASIVWSRPVPANDTLDCDFGAGVAAASTYTHQAATDAVVNATVIGE